MAQSKPPRVGSRSRNQNQDESVYTLAENLVLGCAPRIRTYNFAPDPSVGDAQRPTKMHEDSSQVGNLFNPIRGPRDAQIRAGVTPINHAKNNAMAVKEQSSMNALRKQSEVASISGPDSYKSRSTSAPSRRLSRQDSKDFVRENKVAAAAPSRPSRPASKQDDGQQYLQKKDYGKVPQYLIERKYEQALDDEAKRKAKEDGLIPPGMRIMPEEERLETLAILARNKEEVEKAMQHLPIMIETPSQVRRKDDLERRMREIDEAFKIFSRPKVLVHL